MTVYQEKNFIKWPFTKQKRYKMTVYQLKTFKMTVYQEKNFIKWLFTKQKLYKITYSQNLDKADDYAPVDEV